MSHAILLSYTVPSQSSLLHFDDNDDDGGLFSYTVPSHPSSLHCDVTMTTVCCLMSEQASMVDEVVHKGIRDFAVLFSYTVPSQSSPLHCDETVTTVGSLMYGQVLKV
jgi:hypothetical protein